MHAVMSKPFFLREVETEPSYCIPENRTRWQVASPLYSLLPVMPQTDIVLFNFRRLTMMAADNSTAELPVTDRKNEDGFKPDVSLTTPSNQG